MMRRLTLATELQLAEQRVLERRERVKWRAFAVAARARQQLASPLALAAAAGAGYLLASRSGRGLLAKVFSAAQLGLAALSAFRASK